MEFCQIQFPLLKLTAMKRIILTGLAFASLYLHTTAQALRIPGTANIVNMTGRKVGVTDIMIHYSSPGVKGREGKIYGTSVVPFGYEVLGFGSNVASPWRAGADECTTISFSTDVNINGEKLPAGTYAFFIEVQQDTSVLIFNKNTKEWGSYFYRKDLDVLRVTTKQEKNLPQMQERLVYDFTNQTDSTVDIQLKWERWSFPIHVSVNLKETILEDIRQQMSGAVGFDPASLEAAAQWCVANDINYEEALNWITSATDPNLGGRNSFGAATVRAALLKKAGKEEEAKNIINAAIDNASVMELHAYGRQLLNEQKVKEAFDIFQKNYTKNKGAWPTNMGMLRVYNAMGNYKKALEHAKAALPQAPDQQNKTFIENAITQFSAGKSLQ